MPLMEVVLEQSYKGQQCINRWNYMASGTPAAVTLSFGLLSIMGFLAVSSELAEGTVAGSLQNLQNADVTFIQATARAVYIDEDFYGNPFVSGTVGASVAGGDPQTPLVAFGFRSNRVKQSIGRGYKRFTGVLEGNTGNGGVWSVATVSQMTELAGLMGDALNYDDEGNTLTYTPCIVQKLKYTTPSGREAYKYYPTEVAQSAHIASGIQWQAYDQVRSQTSRQYGRGS